MRHRLLLLVSKRAISMCMGLSRYHTFVLPLRMQRA
jgi:hypothetical protein